MKVIVAVVIHNRFQNLKLWISCWFKSQPQKAELVIIHNYYGDEVLRDKFEGYCNSFNITYVPRNGQGFDIGAMQDVFKERLPSFPDYDYLLWCCDDTLPMIKDFIAPFLKKIKEPGVGISAMQLSGSVSQHVRTTGFMISKEVASKIVFHIEHLKTKQDCYFFEHRGGSKTFTNQIRKMGLSCEAVAPIKTSPLWDSLHPNINYRLDRQEEFKTVWGIENAGSKIIVICPIFDAFPEIISSLICQTYKDWQLLLIDDNPEETICKSVVEAVNDKRVTYIKRERLANYGHPHRQWALKELSEGKLCAEPGYVLITNGDNSYAPVFFEYLIEGFKKNPLASAVYCSEMIHSYINWNIINCKPELGYLDCGGVIVKKEIACEVGWRDIKSHSSDFTYFEDIIKRYSISSFVSVPGALFMHN